jgi:hypothetical protein
MGIVDFTNYDDMKYAVSVGSGLAMFLFVAYQVLDAFIISTIS